MCSRYTYNKDEVKLRLRDLIHIFGVVARANIRPTDLGPVILPEHESFSCKELRWGWSVPWDSSPLINAKCETITSLPTFQPHLQQRCLLLADGFYEKGVRFYQPGGGAFCLAGLFRCEPHGPPGGASRYTMLTTSPNATVAKYHDRMPFILRPEQYDAWLGEAWESVLSDPDHAPLEKFEKQPQLFDP
jgi:putative SOS response-associated peptidase YedK